MSTAAPGIQPSLVDALRAIEIFSDLQPEQLNWFAANCEELQLEPGAVVAHEGEPADSLVVIITGELRGRRENGAKDAPFYLAGAGRVTGLLPFSRMTTFGATVRAVSATRLARFPRELFPEMLQRIPELAPRLVAVLVDRTRESSRVDQQRDKLMALGKLSAGLAHELNNPAAAIAQASARLREAVVALQYSNLKLHETGLTLDQHQVLAQLERESAASLATLPPLDTLAQSDREEELAEWLESRGAADPWNVVPTLVETGFTPASLAKLANVFETCAFGPAICRLVATLTVERLALNIEGSSKRISDLVRSVKEYSYMDRSPIEEIDLRRGIDSTLTLLHHRLKNGVNVIREYEEKLPRVCGHGSEINQVWTNLIVNAIDAMSERRELRIRVSTEADCALVEIIDSGTGIPPELQKRIFEPFFTTKGVGEGTGLGLDTVYRIVRQHHGDIRFTSRPGQTNFQVRLPFTQPKEAKL